MSIVVAEVSVPTDSFEVGTILRDHDYRIDLTQFVPVGESCIPYFWAETEDRAEFEETVEADDRVESLTALDTSDARTLYRIDWAEQPNGFLAIVADHDLLVEDAVGTEGRWRFRLRGPDHENLSSFQQALQDEGIPIHVHRIWNPEPPDDDPYGLTGIQRETLELAFAEGHFDVPRDTSLDELGEMLGVSRQSVSRRLRQGLHNLLGVTLMSETDSGLDESAEADRSVEADSS